MDLVVILVRVFFYFYLLQRLDFWNWNMLLWLHEVLCGLLESILSYDLCDGGLFPYSAQGFKVIHLHKIYVFK